MHQNFEDNEYVKFLGALSDLNQPYSCTQWGNAPDGGYSQIVHDTGSSIYSMLTPNNYVPATVWIDHKMRVHDQMNTAGSWSISSRINSMLEGCGECRIDGELIDDYSADGVRVGLMLSSAAGNDLLFDESLCDQGKSFSNKI